MLGRRRCGVFLSRAYHAAGVLVSSHSVVARLTACTRERSLYRHDACDRDARWLRVLDPYTTRQCSTTDALWLTMDVERFQNLARARGTDELRLKEHGNNCGWCPRVLYSRSPLVAAVRAGARKTTTPRNVASPGASQGSIIIRDDDDSLARHLQQDSCLVLTGMRRGYRKSG